MSIAPSKFVEVTAGVGAAPPLETDAALAAAEAGAIAGTIAGTTAGRDAALEINGAVLAQAQAAAASAADAQAAVADKAETDFANVDPEVGLAALDGVSQTALALPSGASLIATMRTESGAVVRTIQEVARDRVSVKDFGAIGDGTPHALATVTSFGDTDTTGWTLAEWQEVYPFVTSLAQDLDWCAFRAASATGRSVFVPDGQYVLPQSLVLPNTPEIIGQLQLGSGANAGVPDGLIAPDRQIFYGAGTVSGLRVSRAVWFAGSGANNTAIDSQVRLQKASDAAVAGGSVLFPCATFYIEGGTPVIFRNSKQVISEGKSFILWTSRAANAFRFIEGSGPLLRGFQFGSTNALWPTSGKVVDVDNVAYFSAFDVVSTAAYDALTILNGVGHVVSGCRFDNSMRIGVGVQGVNEVFISDTVAFALFDIFTLSSRTGTFTPGEQLTIAGNVVGNFQANLDATSIRGYMYGLNPTVGQTLTGATSGATGVIASQVIPHSVGAFRRFGFVEALTVTNFSTGGGVYGMTTDAGAFVRGQCSAFNKFTKYYSDSTDLGSVFDKVFVDEYIGCWFSSAYSGSGLTLLNTDGVTLNGGQALNNFGSGVVHSVNAKNTVMTGGFRPIGNSREGPGLHPNLRFNAGASDFSVMLCDFRYSTAVMSTMGTPSFDVLVEAGASDRYTIKDNGASATVSDGGTGFNKTVYYGNYGPLRRDFTPTVTASGGTIAVFADRHCRYSFDQGRVRGELRVAITDPGSATGAVLVAMPFAVPRRVVFVGKECAATGALISGSMTPPSGGTTNMLEIVNYLGASVLTPISGLPPDRDLEFTFECDII